MFQTSKNFFVEHDAAVEHDTADFNGAVFDSWSNRKRSSELESESSELDSVSDLMERVDDI